MYSIEVDKSNKLIKIVLSGHMPQKEIEAYTEELNELLYQFEDLEYSLFISAERLYPIAQLALPFISSCMIVALTRSNKIAAVHKKTITRMQMNRVETEATRNSGVSKKVMRFNTTKEAYAYLRN